MFKRPKPGETEEDLLALQEEFLKSDKKDIGVTIVKKYDEGKNNSKFVELNPSENVLTEIVEKNLNTKNFTFQFPSTSDTINCGFPTAFQCKNSDEKKLACRNSEKRSTSIFMQNFNRKNIKTEKESVEKEQLACKNEVSADVEQNLEKLKMKVHEENLHKLNEMSEEEILAEQAKLIKSLDPKLVEFLKTRRKNEENKMLHANVSSAAGLGGFWWVLEPPDKTSD